MIDQLRKLGQNLAIEGRSRGDENPSWEAGRRTKRYAQILHDCNERNCNGRGDLMTAGLNRRCERRAADALVLVLSIRLRSRLGTALADVHGITTRRLFDSAM
jgi:hypothetical protein